MRTLTGVLLTFVTIFSFHFVVSAQEPDFSTLRVIPVYIQSSYAPCEDSNIHCAEYPADLPLPDSANPDYSLRVAAIIPEAVDRDVYIVGCADVESGRVCTSGNQATDTMLRSWGYQMPSAAGRAIQYTYTPGPSSWNSGARSSMVRTDETGSFWINVRSFTRISTNHMFFAVFQGDPVISVAPSPSGPTPTINIKNPAQNQQHMLPPPSPTPTPIPPPQPPPAAESGTGVSGTVLPPQPSGQHDPKGRVFDASTLEPLANVLVTLKNQDGSLAKTTRFSNPQKTMSNGEFYFFVPAGKYVLEVSELPQGYSWPLTDDQTSALLKNQAIAEKNMYYCTKEVGDTPGGVELYEKQHIINVEKTIVHCDIPVYSQSSARKNQELKIVTVGYTTMGTQHQYSGRVTHPFAKVVLADKEGNYVAETQADNLGFWYATVEDSKYPVYNSKLSELQLMASRYSTTGKPAKPQSLNKIFEPIVRSVSGVATDSLGTVVPNATVRVRLLDGEDEAGVVVARADENGRYSIPGDKVPHFEYEIEYADTAGKTVTMKTSDLVLSGRTSQSSSDTMDATGDNGSPVTATQEEEVGSSAIVIVVVGILISLIAAAVVGYYLYSQSKKN